MIGSDMMDYSILFIEDEDEIRANYVTYLKRYFTNVYEASDGEIALKVYKDKKPEILIIDINLPNMSGLELLEIIRKNDHTTRALMLTAHSDTEKLLKASELKLTKYLLKPIDRLELKESLHLAIEELKSFNITSNKKILLKDDFFWNMETEELYAKNNLVSITPIERKILHLLISNIGTVFSKDDIVIYVWDSFEDDKTQALKSALQKLRKKLPEDTLINVYGEGFKIIA